MIVWRLSLSSGGTPGFLECGVRLRLDIQINRERTSSITSRQIIGPESMGDHGDGVKI